MGFTKKIAHTLEQNELSGLFKTLGHPARISILQYISDHPNCICNDMVGEIDLAQATISQHLVELKKFDLIVGKYKGKKTYYRINIDKLYELKQSVSVFLDKIQQGSVV